YQHLLFLKRSLEIRLQKFGDEHPTVATMYHNIGVCSGRLQKNAKAIEYLEKALKIRLANFGEMHFSVADTCYNLGLIFFNKNDYEGCLSYTEKALTIRKKNFDGNHVFVGTAQSMIGRVYLKMGQADRAIHHYQYALENHLAIYGKHSLFVAEIFKSISDCYALKGAVEKALEYIQKAIQSLFVTPVSSDVYVELLSVKSISDSTLLDVLNAKGKLLLKYYESSFDNKRAIEAAFNNSKTTESLIKKVQKSYRTEYANLMMSKEILAIYERNIVISLYMTNSNAFAFTSSEKAKSSLLLASLQDNKAKASADIPTHLLQKEKQLKIELTYMEKSIQKEEAKKDRKDEDLLKKWEKAFFDFHQKYLQLLQQLETDYPDYYQLKYDTKTVTPTELQSALAENQVVISYFVGEEKLYIFAITPDDFEVLDLQKPIGFEDLIEGFMAALTQHQFADFTEKGQQLYQLLIAPIRDFIVDDFGFDEELKQVFVIPHGVLSYVPFEALIEAKPLSRKTVDKVETTLSRAEDLNNSLNKNSWSGLDYLINHCEISYHYSATLLYRHLIKKQNQEEIPNSFAGFAPIYDAQTPSKPTAANLPELEHAHVLQQSAKAMQTWATRSDAIRSDGTWVSLPHSETEAKGIAELFEGKGLQSEVFLREKASKMGFEEAAKQFKFLLVAAHGLVNDEKTALSGLVFYPSDRSEQQDERGETGELHNEDDTERGGVTNLASDFSLLTSQTDSVLSMEETHHLDLHADLVVLSSCESGIGTLHKGEGMMAVNRGFLAAGANNVVSTLFKVYDKPSSLLTQYLFEAILEGEEYATALRLAKLKLMEQPNIDPKSWSGFVFIGG
ncbi:MAG: CHAT domain-containing protein, partial [Chitinophagales bacterium]